MGVPAAGKCAHARRWQPRRPGVLRRGAGLVAVVTLGGAPALADERTTGEPPTSVAPPSAAPAPSAAVPSRSGTSVPIPGTALSVKLVEVSLDERTRLWFGETEIPWEVLDVFVHGLDEGASTPEVDAITRPSKPYISMDRGFGHHGHPAISVSSRNAVEFCRWLSAKTGRRFRLPTLAEWRRTCELGAIAPESLAASAWSRENASRKTHPVGSCKPDGLGLFDLRGNAAEWVDAGEGAFAVVGGSFRDPAAVLGCDAVVKPDPAWNASDPQLPKSEWWLADGGFIGFRVVCENPVDPTPPADRGAVPPAPPPPVTPAPPADDPGSTEKQR